MADLEAKTNAALTTGIIGTAGTGLALLNGGLGNILGGLMGNNCNNGGLNGMAGAAALAGVLGALGAGRHSDCGCYPAGAYNTAPICENQIVNAMSWDLYARSTHSKPALHSVMRTPTPIRSSLKCTSTSTAR